MSLKCTFCAATWETLPPNAQQVGTSRGSFRMYLIDGTPHYIGSARAGRNKKTGETVREQHEHV